jgi:hypothetical protein
LGEQIKDYRVLAVNKQYEHYNIFKKSERPDRGTEKYDHTAPCLP